jgi:hypothetical protein
MPVKLVFLQAQLMVGVRVRAEAAAVLVLGISKYLLVTRAGDWPLLLCIAGTHFFYMFVLAKCSYAVNAVSLCCFCAGKTCSVRQLPVLLLFQILNFLRVRALLTSTCAAVCTSKVHYLSNDNCVLC